MWNVFLQAVSKKGVVPTRAVTEMEAPVKGVSKVDTSCQVDDPAELPIKGMQSLYQSSK